MTTQNYGMIIGGVLPAIFFGLSGVFAKPATQAGIGIGLYLIIGGLSAALVGLVFCFLTPDRTLSLHSFFFTSLVGITWAIAAGLVVKALVKYEVPISKLVPLYNMNTLIAVLLGLMVFAEWKDVSITKLVFGSLFIIAGGALVASA